MTTIEQTNDESGAAPVVLRAWGGVVGGDCECCNRRNCLAARVRDAILRSGG